MALSEGLTLVDESLEPVSTATARALVTAVMQDGSGPFFTTI